MRGRGSLPAEGRLVRTQFTDEAICRVIGSAIPHLRESAIKPDARLRRDLGLDSLGLMGVVLMLQDKLAIDAFKYAQEFLSAEQVSDVIAIVRHEIPA